MNQEHHMKFVVDWTANRQQFEANIDNIIQTCVEKKLGIPVNVRWSDTGAISAVLSNINCDSCNALCCKSNPNGMPTAISFTEYNRIKDMLGEQKVHQLGIALYMSAPPITTALLPMPCPFLDNKNKCTIYDMRFAPCFFYPVLIPKPRSGVGDEISLASECPKARTLVKRMYLSEHKIRDVFREAMQEIILSTASYE